MSDKNQEHSDQSTTTQSSKLVQCQRFIDGCRSPLAPLNKGGTTDSQPSFFD